MSKDKLTLKEMSTISGQSEKALEAAQRAGYFNPDEVAVSIMVPEGGQEKEVQAAAREGNDRVQIRKKRQDAETTFRKWWATPLGGQRLNDTRTQREIDNINSGLPSDYIGSGSREDRRRLERERDEASDAAKRRR